MSDIDRLFPLPLRGEYVTAGKWKLTAVFEYRNEPIRVVKVPIGFITDGASIPRFAWVLIGSPWSGKYARAAVIHDYLYSKHYNPRKKADEIFLHAMEVLKVSWWRRYAMWSAVRLFGRYR